MLGLYWLLSYFVGNFMTAYFVGKVHCYLATAVSGKAIGALSSLAFVFSQHSEIFYDITCLSRFS